MKRKINELKKKENKRLHMRELFDIKDMLVVILDFLGTDVLVDLILGLPEGMEVCRYQIVQVMLNDNGIRLSVPDKKEVTLGDLNHMRCRGVFHAYFGAFISATIAKHMRTHKMDLVRHISFMDIRCMEWFLENGLTVPNLASLKVEYVTRPDLQYKDTYETAERILSNVKMIKSQKVKNETIRLVLPNECPNVKDYLWEYDERGSYEFISLFSI